MNVSQASKIWLDYHRAHSKENTVRAYKFTIEKLPKFLKISFGYHLVLKGSVGKLI